MYHHAMGGYQLLRRACATCQKINVIDRQLIIQQATHGIGGHLDIGMRHMTFFVERIVALFDAISPEDNPSCL